MTSPDAINDSLAVDAARRPVSLDVDEGDEGDDSDTSGPRGAVVPADGVDSVSFFHKAMVKTSSVRVRKGECTTKFGGGDSCTSAVVWRLPAPNIGASTRDTPIL